MLPQRKVLPHRIPDWVPDGSIFFLTINTEPPGINQLARQEVFDRLLKSVTFRVNRGEWYVHVFLCMPDHVHALMTFPKFTDMKKSIGQWKRYTARNLSINWQRDYFDHRLRGVDSFDEKANYILMNPVRKMLCANIDDWPYAWCPTAALSAKASYQSESKG